MCELDFLEFFPPKPPWNKFSTFSSDYNQNQSLSPHFDMFRNTNDNQIEVVRDSHQDKG